MLLTAHTPFYPKRTASLIDAYNRLERELFGPWSLFNSGKPITVSPCEGKPIQIGDSGVEFSGSVRDIFWRFFDPDIKKVISDHLEQTVKDCEGMPDLLEEALDETRELLDEFIRRAYERLVHIDQRLRGKGFPNSVAPQNVDGKIQLMKKMLDEHVEAAMRHAALLRLAKVVLEQNQKDLLVTLIEAVRNSAEGEHESIRVSQDRSRVFLEHRGFRGQTPQVNFHDLEVLAVRGLINLTTGTSKTIWNIDINPEGYRYYRDMGKVMVQPVQERGAVPKAPARQAKGESYDVFISHASEDKDAFVRPLAEALRSAGIKVWYDEFTLKWGASLRESIDRGLATSRYGLVVLSHSFFAKDWPQRELNGLFATMKAGERRILPIWHQLSGEEVKKYSPMLSDLLAVNSTEGVPEIVQKVLSVCRGP
jgi:TIR domain-containing protein